MSTVDFQWSSYAFVMQVRVGEVRTTPKTIFPKGSFVDLLHSDCDTDIVEKGRLGKEVPGLSARMELRWSDSNGGYEKRGDLTI